MTLDEIGQIVATLDASDITECEITSGAHALRVRFDRTVLVAGASALVVTGADNGGSHLPTSPSLQTIRASAAGVVRLMHPLAPVSLVTGAPVKAGQVLAYLEIDSVLCAVVSGVDGIVQTIHVEEGARVGFGALIVDVTIDAMDRAMNGTMSGAAHPV